LKLLTDKLIRFFASVEWSLLLLRSSLVLTVILVACNWGILGSRNLPFDGLNRYSACIAVIAAVFIMVHLLVVALIRNSRGMKHTTLSMVQIALSVLIPVTCMMGLSYRYFDITANRGEEMRFLESTDTFELAVVNHEDATHDKVYVTDWKKLRTGKIIQHKDWIFHLKIMVRYPNAVFGHLMARKIDSRGKHIFGISASQGYAEQQGIKMFSVSGTDSKPGLLVEIVNSGNEKLGSFLLNAGDLLPIPPQFFQVDGKSYSIDLRKRRYYPGFSWRVSPDSTGGGAVLQITRSDEKQFVKPVGFSRRVTFNGLRFQLSPEACDTPVRLNSIRLSVSKNPYGLLWIIVSLLTTVAALIHCSINLWIQKEEEIG
jgi:hypothetical protein